MVSANQKGLTLVEETVGETLGPDLLAALDPKGAERDFATQMLSADVEAGLLVKLLGAEPDNRRQLAGQAERDGTSIGGRFGSWTGPTAKGDVERALRRFTKLFQRLHCAAGGGVDLSGARASAQAQAHTCMA